MTESCQWKVSGRDVSRALKTADVQCLHSLPFTFWLNLNVAVALTLQM